MNHPANIPPPNWQEGRKPGRCPSMFPRLPLLYWHECDGTFRYYIFPDTGLTRSISSASTTTGVVVSCVILLLDSTLELRWRRACGWVLGVPLFSFFLPPPSSFDMASRLPAVFLFWLCIVQSSKICRSSSTSPISSTVIFWSRKLYEKIFRVDRLFLYDRDFKE